MSSLASLALDLSSRPVRAHKSLKLFKRLVLPVFNGLLALRKVSLDLLEPVDGIGNPCDANARLASFLSFSLPIQLSHSVVFKDQALELHLKGLAKFIESHVHVLVALSSQSKLFI